MPELTGNIDTDNSLLRGARKAYWDARDPQARAEHEQAYLAMCEKFMALHGVETARRNLTAKTPG